MDRKKSLEKELTRTKARRGRRKRNEECRSILVKGFLHYTVQDVTYIPVSQAVQDWLLPSSPRRRGSWLRPVGGVYHSRHHQHAHELHGLPPWLGLSAVFPREK